MSHADDARLLRALSLGFEDMMDWIAAEARLIGESIEPTALSAREAIACLEPWARRLATELPRPGAVGLIADNAPHWLAVDVALQAAGIAVVPMPTFFSRQQMLHAVGSTHMQALVCQDETLAAQLGFSEKLADGHGMAFRRDAHTGSHTAPVPQDVRKISFTSGTTGTSKGVLLTLDQQWTTARGLARILQPLGIRRHLSVLPFPVLLENVAGAYTALMLGATCICPALESIGLQGASGFDAERCLDAIVLHQPDSLILLPQMLQALVAHLAAVSGRGRYTRSLKFVAVGGSRTPPDLIRKARALGIPVYEGYGLTECASVVSLNVPGADRIHSVGRALPGVRLRIAPDAEIEVAGRTFAGYLDDAPHRENGWLRTGDLGTMDASGFVNIVGRKKHVIITSFGRNVSPEWPEQLLLESLLVGQAVAFGNDRPFLTAVLVAASCGIADAAIASHVEQMNGQLPDYARIGGWVRAVEPFTERNGLATANGRLRRGVIELVYARQLDDLYRNAAARSAPTETPSTKQLKPEPIE